MDRIWTKDGFKLKLSTTGKYDSYGKYILKYEFYDGDKLIFSGEDFHCPPSVGPLSDESVYTLLSFFTLQEGDTDDEHFENYTQEQIEWRDSGRCQDLSMLVMEFEDDES